VWVETCEYAIRLPLIVTRLEAPGPSQKKKIPQNQTQWNENKEVNKTTNKKDKNTSGKLREKFDERCNRL
jgi:hypothetical protein